MTSPTLPAPRSRPHESTDIAIHAPLLEQDATRLEPARLEANTEYCLRYAQGPDRAPRPATVRDGSGVCRVCAGQGWDAPYVVTDDVDTVKFGITSRDMRPRLRVHRGHLLEQVVQPFRGLPVGVAYDVERTSRIARQKARHQQVRGREYFTIRSLPLVLNFVDHYRAHRSLLPKHASAANAVKP